MMPYPGYHDLYARDNTIYAAMGNGQVAGYAGLNGQLQYLAERQSDSVPEKIIVLDEYLVAYYNARINARKSLVTFYMASGVKKHQYPLDFEVVSLFQHPDPEKCYVFGNKDGAGIMAVFTPRLNRLGEQHGFDDRINAVCRINDDEFVLLVDRWLYDFNSTSGEYRLLKSLSDSAFSVKYEKVRDRLYILFEDRLQVCSFPDMVDVQEAGFEEPLKGIAFYYRHE